MRSFTATLAVAVAAAAPALAQQSAYAQCGGQGWSGSTTCVSGYACTFSNTWYSQCLPGTAASTAPAATTRATSATGFSTSTRTSSPTPTSGGGSLPWWVGVNLSGAEFGEGKYPGIYNKDYTWYDKSAIDQLIAKGFNMFRINFSMERLTNGLTGDLAGPYMSNLTDTVNYITSKGAWAMIQPHNYGRFNGAIITDVTGFQSWWQKVAAPFKNNQKVVFDTNNEFHDMENTLVYNLNQAAINGIRAAGATSQWITPEGNCWTGAWSWISCGNANLGSLTDPSNKLIYQMHQYLDSDGSGTHAECVSSTIFQERLVAATQWLKDNKKVGVIGEFAGGANSQCISALNGGLKYLKANKDVWTGALWWAAGPWWADYMYNMEPPSGIAWTNVVDQIMGSWK